MDGVGSGFVAMVLGAIGWLNDRPPTVSGINENTSSQQGPVRWPVGSVEQHFAGPRC